jgi:hypothetical protein
MYNRTFISLFIAFMFLIPLIPGDTGGEFDPSILDMSPHWKDFSRDLNGNGVDDIIDDSDDTLHSIIIVYSDTPSDKDVKDVESLGLNVWYRAKYNPYLLVRDVTKSQINIIKYIRGVRMVELNPTMEPLLEHSTKGLKARPTNMADDGVDYGDVWEELGYNGTGVNVAILDTGVNDIDHESLDDMDDDLFTIDSKFIAGWDLGVGGAIINPHDRGPTGHGTHVAGIAIGTGGASTTYSGIAPGARLVDVKTLTDAGVGGFIIPAIEWCIDNKDTDWANDGEANDGIQILSMSLGGPDSNGDDAASQTANTAVGEGLVIVAATGNDGTRRISTPAAADGVIAVAASHDQNNADRSDDSYAGYSNYGPRGDGFLKPEVTATGSQVMAPTRDSWQAYNNFDGTSMATPHVAGVIALMLQANPDLTPAEVKDIIKISSSERGSNHISPEQPKYDTHWGWGLVDAYAAVNLALGLPDLTVASIEVRPSGSNEGDSIRILADIEEINGRDAEADIEFYDETNGKIIKTVSSFFAADATNTISSGDFTALGGDRTFRVRILNTSPGEKDDTNNQMLHSTHINYRPEPAVSADPETVKTSDDIQISGEDSTDQDGTVESYYFDFGDGKNTGWQDEDSVIHRYEDNGEYEVTLKVRDDKDAESTDVGSVTVTIENRAPSAGAGSDRTAVENEEVEFSGTAEDEDGTIDLWEWDFENDGTFDYSSSENGDTSHSYSKEGNYTAILRVTDDDGATGTDDRIIEVLAEGTPNTPPQAIMTKPEDGKVYQDDMEMIFDGRSSFDPDGDTISYAWTDNGLAFGDEDRFNAFLESGDHRIILQVDDGRGGVDSSEVNIRVNSAPTAGMNSPEDGETYFSNIAIDFDASTSSDPNDDDLSFLWKIDGSEASTEEQFEQKLAEGEYDIELTVDDGNDRTDSVFAHIIVEKPKNRPPIASISSPVNEQEFRDNETITFDGRESSDPDDDPIIFEWYIDNIKKSTDPLFSIDQEVEGSIGTGDHEVHLIVWDDKDENDHAYATITITDNKKPIPRITDPKDGEVYTDGVAIDFDGSNSEDPENDELSYLWKDGEEEISSEARFSRVLSPGEHTIYLTVSDSRKEDTTSVDIRVNKPPRAIIDNPTSGDVYFSDEVVMFDASSSSDSDGKIVSFIWESNGERLGTGKTMEKALDTGEQDITLTVKDDNSARHSTTVNVKAVDHSIAFTIQDSTKEVDPDEEAIFQLKISNLAEKSDLIRLSSEEVVTFEDEEFILGPNSERTITMRATSSRDLDIPITAWAGQFPFYTTAKLRMSQIHDLEISTSKNALKGAPGTSLNYILVVTNNGNGKDTISVRFETATWTVSLSPESLDLHPGTSGQVIVKVKIPDSAVKGNNLVLDVTATAKDGETKATITLTTTVEVIDPGPETNDVSGDDGLGMEGFIVILGIALAASVTQVKRKR